MSKAVPSHPERMRRTDYKLAGEKRRDEKEGRLSIP
jgi:hypothetical protein